MKKAQSSLFAAVLACALFSSDAFSPSSIITPLRAGLTAPSIRAAGERANPTLRDRVPSRARATTTPLHLKALFGLGGSGKKKVGVIGATGGVGRLAVAYLLEQGCEVRAIVRDKDRAAALLPSNIELKIGDMADPTYGEGLATAISGVDALICATGTTAFPTDKWGENRKNNPKAVDEDGIKNVVAAISEVNKKNGRKMKKIALLSSIGVERRDQFPFTLLNFYGVLDAKFAGEQAVKGGAKSAGYSYALARLGRLVGGPYTGTPDVASLLQLEEGSNQAITMRKGDPKAFAGDLSRKQGAMALVQSVLTDKQDFEFAIVNKPGPQPTQQEWDTAFMNLDLDMAEEIRDFSFLVTDLVAKASKVFEDAQLSNNIVGFDSAKLQKASSKIVSFGKEMLTKVQAWSESDKSKVSTLETDKDKLS